jgi:hypothetical protein
MAHSFKFIPARPTFGTFNESNDAGCYILNKKAKATFCAANNCRNNTKVNSQGNLLLLKNSNYLNFYKSTNNINPINLNINLITKLNLKDVPVIQSNIYPYETPTSITPNSDSSTIYLDYVIDPSGKLFGNTPCGYNNYLNYLEYNPPYTTYNPGK